MSAPSAPPARPSRHPGRRRFAAVAVTAAVLDLASKVAASAALARRDINLPGPLDLRLSHNPGVAFGVGDTVPAWLLLTLTGGVAVFVAVAGWREAFNSTTGGGLVLGGAIANIANRLQTGTVVDMFYLGWWPTFNLADACITVGVALILLSAARADSRPVPGDD